MAGARGGFSRDLPKTALYFRFSLVQRTCTHIERIIIMSSAKTGSLAVDQARQFLCREFARSMNAGNFTVRVRIARLSTGPVAAWFYSHRDDGWHKEPESVTDRELVVALDETLDMLASRGHCDEWLSRRHKAADHCDTDLQFHREKLEGHLGDNLEWLLTGLLFRDNHESKKDVRHSVRVPRRQTVR
jgi:hypothetical protein